jgi:hypothetical protein
VAEGRSGGQHRIKKTRAQGCVAKKSSRSLHKIFLPLEPWLDAANPWASNAS